MKGLILLFMLFGLGVTLGTDGDNVTAVTDLAPAIELPAIVDLTSSTEEKTTETIVSAEKEEGTYELEIKDSNRFVDGFKHYTSVENGALYSCKSKMYGDSYKVSFLYENLMTGEQNTEVELTTDSNRTSVFYVHPSNEGGYFALASNWNGKGADYNLLTFDEGGKLIEKKCLNDAYDMQDDFVFANNPVSDGTYIYIPCQNHGLSGKNADGLLMFDVKGNLIKELIDSENAYACIGSDGLVYIMDGPQGELKAYNPDNDELSEAILRIDGCYGSLFNGEDGELLFGYDTIYSFNYKTNSLKELFTMSDFDIYPCPIIFMYRDGNGDVVIFYEDTTDDSQSTVVDLEARFNKK